MRRATDSLLQFLFAVCSGPSPSV